MGAMNETKRMDRQIKLKDRRMLGYAEYGVAKGRPIFCFHGFPGSRLDWLMFDLDNLAEAIPNCSATFLEDEGHFSILRCHVPEILKVLLAWLAG